MVPILYRLASAAFFNISLLTGNFWVSDKFKRKHGRLCANFLQGVIIGLQVFHLHVHWLYPIAFTLIILGHFFYYVGKGVLGEAKKAWLGEDQANGIMGIGTAKRKIHRGNNGMRTADGTDQGIEHESAGIV